jgi:hypothetical protein
MKIEITIHGEPIWIHREQVRPNGPQLSADWKQKARNAPLRLELYVLDGKNFWRKLEGSGAYWVRHFPTAGTWDRFTGAGNDKVTIKSQSGAVLFLLASFGKAAGKAGYGHVPGSWGSATYSHKASWRTTEAPQPAVPKVWLGMGFKGALSAVAAGMEWWWGVVANITDAGDIFGLRCASGCFGPQLGVGVSAGLVLVTGVRKPAELWGTQVTSVDWTLDVEESWATYLKNLTRADAFVKAVGRYADAARIASISFEQAAKALSQARPDLAAAAKTIASNSKIDFQQKTVAFIDLYGKGLRFGVYWCRGWIHRWDTVAYPAREFIETTRFIRGMVSNPRATRSLNEDPFLKKALREYGGQDVKIFRE